MKSILFCFAFPCEPWLLLHVPDFPGFLFFSGQKTTDAVLINVFPMSSNTLFTWSGVAVSVFKPPVVIYYLCRHQASKTFGDKIHLLYSSINVLPYLFVRVLSLLNLSKGTPFSFKKLCDEKLSYVFII